MLGIQYNTRIQNSCLFYCNFTIQFNSNSSGKIGIAVHDVSGRLILNKSYSNTGLFNEKVKLDNAQAGIYLVTITDGDKKKVKRIVVQ